VFLTIETKVLLRVQALASKRVFYINKEGFLLAFRDAFFNMFIYSDCKKAFKALGLVPINAQAVLN
jgi:hypothetical protein